MALKTYDFKNVHLLVGGRRITGFSEGGQVSVTREVESFIKSVGSDGEFTRSSTNDKSGVIEFGLQQTSESNSYLQGLINTDEATKNGTFPVSVVDKKGTTVVVSAVAYVEKPADLPFGRDSQERTWRIICSGLSITGGGN